jgi:hypothetical protein
MLTHDGRHIDRNSTPSLQVKDLVAGDRVKKVFAELYQGEDLGSRWLNG